MQVSVKYGSSKEVSKELDFVNTGRQNWVVKNRKLQNKLFVFLYIVKIKQKENKEHF